ncbi:MAG: hypothetical protein AB1846_07690 [Chloroflexota bacterium]
MYRVKRWGDPVLVADANLTVGGPIKSNFQAVSVWNDAFRDFGAIEYYLRIPQADVMRLKALQTFPDGYTANQKMQWLGGDPKGRIYMHEQNENWDTAEFLRWGTLTLGNNLVQVDKISRFAVHLPALPAGQKVTLDMGRLVCFTPADWGATHESHPHLIHRAWCVGANNALIDSPKGIVYTPLWSPLHWTFIGPAKPQPTGFWIPMRWLDGV